MVKLTKTTVDALNPADGELVVWDDGLPGFGLRAKASGAKSFIVQYRNANGRSRRLTVGRYGILTVDEARKAAKVALAEVLKGADPAESRKLARGAMTIAELAAEYMDKAEKGLILTKRGEPKSETTIYTDKGRVTRHIVPLIGKRTVQDFTASDAGRFQRDVIAGKSAANVKTKLRGRAIVKGGKGTAARTVGLLGGIFTYAVNEGYRTDNPISGIVRPKDKKRKWRLDDHGYRRFGRCLATAETADEHWQRIMAARVVALTGCRLTEIEALLKSDVDAAAGALRLTSTKTGESVRPIGHEVVLILKAAAAKSNSKYVFPAIGDVEKHLTGLTRWIKAKASKAVPGITSHGLRHSFSSTAEDLGFTIPTIKALIGHASASVTEGYIHKIDSALLVAANQISNHIEMAMGGTKSVKDNGAT